MNDKIADIHTKVCLECSRPLGVGRDDRKFCNDSCRTAYNNRRRKENTAKEPEGLYKDNPDFRKIYEIILNNRNLLMMWDHFREPTYMLRDLIGKGFIPKYFTSECEIDGLLFKFCFDYGYHITERGRIYIEEGPGEIFC